MQSIKKGGGAPHAPHLGHVLLALPVPLADQRLKRHVHQRQRSAARQQPRTAGLAGTWCTQGMVGWAECTVQVVYGVCCNQLE
jgi:hypothetical protein